jgi:fructose-bisphosphate aldolase class I
MSPFGTFRPSRHVDEMFDLVHQMCTRIITSPSFTGERIIGAILFEDTMDREIEGQPTADYLWKVKRVVPFLRVDKGLQAEKDGVQMMKPMPELALLLDKAKSKRIFGTKMRSVIKQANPTGIKNIVNQQFEIGQLIIATGLVPIVEPEVDIHSPEKAKAEELLKAAIVEKLQGLAAGQQVMLKLTVPEKEDLYSNYVHHSRVVRVVALSGGYTQKKPTTACAGSTVSWRASHVRWSRGCRSIKRMPRSTQCWMLPLIVSTRPPTPKN